jgi:activated CDC42 kinase 1
MILQCWEIEPSCRPTFSALRAELSNRFPEVLQATQAYREEGDSEKLKLDEGDKIAVIDGRKDHYFWKGQNQRTYDVGLFPRAYASPLRRRLTDDISRPLRNSMVIIVSSLNFLHCCNLKT